MEHFEQLVARASSSSSASPGGRASRRLRAGSNRWRARAATLGWVTALLLHGSSGCVDADDADGTTTAATVGASPAASIDGTRGPQFALPPPLPFDSNPLGLRAAVPALEPKREVFTVPKRMLAGAREGSSLALRAATVERVEGGNVVVRMGREPPYSVHPAYVVAPRGGAVRRGRPVVGHFVDDWPTRWWWVSSGTE